MIESATVIDQRLQVEWLAAALDLADADRLFPWQTELLRSFPESGARRYSLDVPTGLGKTSVMAVWLVARALGKNVPRRLVYVVDRRTVVDQATEEAERLRKWVESRPEVKRALRLKHGLPVSTLRGKHIDNREWLEDPSSPAIVVGTVDMIGSRLLFEGYRTSRKMRPYHAGLLAVDVLLVLDEAHLVPPFESLLQAIARNTADFGPSHGDASLPPFLLMTLSATGTEREPSPESRSFSLTAADLIHPGVRKRLDAGKRLRLIPLTDPRLLAETLADRAWALATRNDRARRCLVYCQRRETARQVYDLLRMRCDDIQLLVGARRLHEREHAAKRLRELGFLADSRTARSGPAFLVATSAGEVGIDLDADDMVSDLVAWERMVQRFGRVNRRGDGKARIEVLAVDETGATSSSEDVPTSKAADIARLRAPFSHLPTDADGGIDVSPGALRELKARLDIRDEIVRASTPVPLHPPLTRALLDAWSMTSLLDHTGRPRIEPWLRGWGDDEPAQCAVAWRSLLPVPADSQPVRKDVEAFFDAAPIHPLEVLETDAVQVADALIARAGAARKVDLVPPDRVVAFVLEPGEGVRKEMWTIARLCEKEIRRRKTRDVLVEEVTGRTVILDACLGGLSEGLLDRTQSAPPPTLDGRDPFDDEGVIGYRVRLDYEEASAPDPDWKRAFTLVLERDEEGDPKTSLVVEERKGAASTEEARAVATRPQLLDQHQAWTEKRAEELARALAPEHVHVFTLAARLHDEGKRARRWQRAFRAPADGVYAKTRGPVNTSLLCGYRHEFGSLSHAADDDRLHALDDDDRDLVLHLIAAHHGFARPLISAEGCEDAPPSALEERRREVALRFVRLQERWGPWGLAWLEALLRAADQQASRANEEPS